MSTRYEGFAAPHATMTIAPAGTWIGEELTETPALVISGDEVAYVTGTHEELGALLTSALAALHADHATIATPTEHEPATTTDLTLLPCDREDDGDDWHCDLPSHHDGPHVAYTVGEDGNPTDIVGKAWTTDPTEHYPTLVTWDIDVTDPDMSPEDAARWALGIHRDPDSIATVFVVHMSDGTTRTIDVDPTELGDVTTPTGSGSVPDEEATTTEPVPDDEVEAVTLSYTVPVQVIVNVRTGTVRRVVVVDDALTRDAGTYDRDAETDRPVSPDMVARALAVVDSPDVDWPGWDFGF